jgi:hypothetical protein
MRAAAARQATRNAVGAVTASAPRIATAED